MSWRSAAPLPQPLAFHSQLSIEGKLRYDTGSSTQHHELEVSCSAASASGLPFTAQHWGKAQVWYRDLYAVTWSRGQLLRCLSLWPSFTAQHWGKAQVWYRDLYAAPWAGSQPSLSFSLWSTFHNYAVGDTDSICYTLLIFVLKNTFFFGRIYGGDLEGTPTDQATLILSPI